MDDGNTVQIDFSSPAWHQLRRFAEMKLDRARARNDAVGLDAVATAALRGEISAWKQILGLPSAATRGVVTESA